MSSLQAEVGPNNDPLCFLEKATYLICLVSFILLPVTQTDFLRTNALVDPEQHKKHQIFEI